MSDKNAFANYLPITIVSLLFLSQIVFGVYLLSWVSQNEILAYFGVIFYIFAGVFFGMLPVFEFRKRGGVRKGQSYIHTTKLVDTGIYSIVRHPQYVTFFLWAISGMLLFQHWIIILLGIPIFPLTYIDLVKADEDAIEKFGDAYKAYTEKVPRANFFLGLFRLSRRRRKGPGRTHEEIPRDLYSEINRDSSRKLLVKYTREAFKLLPRLDKSRILDVGCGSGIPTIELAKLSKGNLVGIDIDQVYTPIPRFVLSSTMVKCETVARANFLLGLPRRDDS